MQAASGGRFVLGIGLSHQMVIENMFGLSFDKPVRHMREYLSVLMPLIHDGKASFTGETISHRTRPSASSRDSPCPVLVAALGDADAEARGHAHRRHGHVDDRARPRSPTTPSPRSPPRPSRRAGPRRGSSTSLPICVTTDIDAARERAATRLPGLRIPAVVPRDARPRGRGRSRPTSRSSATRATVEKQVRALADAGVTEFVAVDLRLARRARADPRAAEVDVVSPTVSGDTPAHRSSCSRRSASKRSRSCPVSRTSRSTRCAGCSRSLWHGPATRADVVVTCGGGMGGLLGPADGLYHDLGVHLAETHGIATMRVGYRKPNDLSRCVHDVAAAADLASRSGARGFVVMGHSFGGAVAVQAGTVLGDALPGRRDALDPVGRVRARVGARRHSPAAAARHRRRDPARRRRARSCRCSPGTARSCCSPAPAISSRRPRRELRERLSAWIPERFATASET